MGYSNAVAQKQNAERGDSFSGVNAQRKMGAVPVLQRVAEEEVQLKDAVVQKKIESAHSSIKVEPQQQFVQLKMAHIAAQSIQMMKPGSQKFKKENGTSLERIRAEADADKDRKRKQGWAPGLHDHIFKGDNTEKGKIKGFHSTYKADTAVLVKTGDPIVGAHGVYSSKVSDRNNPSITKLSTFFPDGTTDEEIRVAINMRGTNGYPTEGPLQNIEIANPGDGTAFPIKK